MKDIKNTLDKVLHQQIIDDIRHKKFNLALSIMRDVERSSPEQIGRTYRYLFEDEIERVEMQDTVVKEFQSGKFNPVKRTHRP